MGRGGTGPVQFTQPGGLLWLDGNIYAFDENADSKKRDSHPGGKLDKILKRVHEDISAGKTKPLDEVIDNP